MIDRYRRSEVGRSIGSRFNIEVCESVERYLVKNFVLPIPEKLNLNDV